jgi:hypothetical protein
MIIRKGNNRARWVDAGPSEGRAAPQGSVGGSSLVPDPGPFEAHRRASAKAKAAKREAAA